MVIYKITNIVNGKVYIGQTVQTNPKMRWYEHWAAAKSGHTQHLYKSMRKYGVDAFAWKIIDQAETIEVLNQLETKWISHYRGITKCYNHRDGGDNSLHSNDSIEKMRESQKAAHARRRAEGCEGGWKRRDGGAMKGKCHPKKGKSATKWSDDSKEKLRI